MALTEGLQWYGLDGHLHTDHSHDAGFFHQQEKKPENHDTFVADQLGAAELAGEKVATLTDHRTYDQAYDPDYRSETMTLLDGEEWGSYPHATAWAITEVLEQGPDEGVCGVARAAPEVRAQDAIFGIAHPEDGRRPCIDLPTLKNTPIDHLEAFRGPNTSFWAANAGGGRRLAPVTGSDNHFRQLYGTEGGPGGNTTFILAASAKQASLVQAIRDGRVVSTTRTMQPRMTTSLDADLDDVFDAFTGGWAVPTGGTVRVAFRIEGGSGHWLQVLDESSNIVSQEPVTTTDQTFIYDVPASSSLYRGQLAIEPAERVTAPSYLEYFDSLRVLSAPVYLSAPEPVEDGDQGAATELGGAPFSGFADLAASEGTTHAVWQERRGDIYSILHSTSVDDGQTWSAPEVRSGAMDARMPTVAVDGQTVAISWEDDIAGAHGGRVVLSVSQDGGDTFATSTVANGARPDLAVSGSRVHLVWMSQEDGYKIRYLSYGGGSPVDQALLSSAVSREAGLAHPMSIPPRVLKHVPAAVHPAIVADGASVVVAWEDNREDPTPLRNGTPDDWGIYGAVSTDGGATFSPDARWTPRHDRKAATPTSVESLEGNPARHPDLMLSEDGSLVLAYDDPFGSGGANIYVRRSTDLAATWSTPFAVTSSPELETRPRLRRTGGTIEVLFQGSTGRDWTLRSALSTDGGLSFGAPTTFSTGSGYAGFPAVAGNVAAWTGESDGIYRVFTAPTIAGAEVP